MAFLTRCRSQSARLGYCKASSPGAHMQRRAFITLLSAGAVAWPIGARGQQLERMRRIGVLTGTAADDPEAQARHAAFVQGLAQLGWTDGRNVRIEARWTAGNAADTRKY